MMKDFSRKTIESVDRKELMKELKDIASMSFPGDVAKQNATKIITFLRFQDGKITKKNYDNFWDSFLV